MMKKLLVLALVLAVAGLANAGLALNVTGQTVTLVGSGFTTVTDNNFTSFLVFTLPASAPVLNYVQNSVVTDYMFNAGGFEALLGLDAGAIKAAYQVEIADTQEPFVLPNGTLLTATTTGNGMVYLLDQTGAPVGQPAQVGIPEPMTMVLLGLGGLFLRKKK